ncbi:MAG: DUF2273 domain-containing protein [Spirochaetes bacterium]|nr:DUF2273 domain-containing protein [Spirochaetota bacterium]
MNELNNDKNFLNYLKDWINSNPGTAVGVIVGLVLGIFLFTLGIVKTIFLAVFMLIGYWLGRSKDEKNSVIDQVSNFFKRNDK